MNRRNDNCASLSQERVFLCSMLHRFATGLKCGQSPENLDWLRFQKIVDANGLSPLVHTFLKNTKFPEIIHQKWQKISISNFYRNKLLLASTVKLFTILEKENIPAVALRGIVMAHKYYPDPIMRPMSDVDVLVESDKYASIAGQLKAHGLDPIRILRSQYRYYINNGLFEIHGSFLTPKRYRQMANFDTWIQFRQPFESEKGKIFVLRPEDEFVALICHMFLHHEIDNLLKLVDIAIMLNSNDLDWGYIFSWSQETGLMRVICFAIALIDYLLEVRPQKDIWEIILSHLPPHADMTFEAYAAPLFLSDRRFFFLRRKINMLYIAETLNLRMLQLLRFISIDHITGWWQAGKQRKHAPADNSKELQ